MLLTINSDNNVLHVAKRMHTKDKHKHMPTIRSDKSGQKSRFNTSFAHYIIV